MNDFEMRMTLNDCLKALSVSRRFGGKRGLRRMKRRREEKRRGKERGVDRLICFEDDSPSTCVAKTNKRRRLFVFTARRRVIYLRFVTETLITGAMTLDLLGKVE